MGLNLKKSFGTDRALETDGKWFDVGDGCELLIARDNNPAYRTELRRLMRPHTAAARAETLEAKDIDPLITKAMAQHILKGWKNLYLDEGKPVGPYSPEKAARLMTDFPDFRDLVAELAGERTAFLAVEVEQGKATSGK